MDTGERIKELRKGKGETLKTFGEHIGFSPSAVSDVENGRNTLTNQMARAICAEYNVNEEWLRDGTGEPFRQMSEDDKLAAFFGDALADESTSFRRRFFKMLSMLSVEQWEEMEHLWRMAAELPEEKKD